MKAKFLIVLFLLIAHSSILFSQEVVKVEQNEKETRYFAESLNLYFSIPNGWKVTYIPSEHDIPPGIGLTPNIWNYSVLENGDTLDQSEFAIEIRAGNGSIDSTLKAEGKSISDLSGKLVELKNWRYLRVETDTRLYIKGGGYYGMENCYTSTLDNRHGKIVWLIADPLYKELKSIYNIENSLSFK